MTIQKNRKKEENHEVTALGREKNYQILYMKEILKI